MYTCFFFPTHTWIKIHLREVGGLEGETVWNVAVISEGLVCESVVTNVRAVTNVSLAKLGAEHLGSPYPIILPGMIWKFVSTCFNTNLHVMASELLQRWLGPDDGTLVEGVKRLMGAWMLFLLLRGTIRQPSISPYQKIILWCVCVYSQSELHQQSRLGDV